MPCRGEHSGHWQSLKGTTNVLYREAVLAGAAGCGWVAHGVEQSALPTEVQAVGALGRAAGRPWCRFEKDAARVALAFLAIAAGRD